MTDVACFCGCLFLFDGAAGACPQCSAVASVTAGPALESPMHHNRPEHPVPVINGAGQDMQNPGRLPGTGPSRRSARIAMTGRDGGPPPHFTRGVIQQPDEPLADKIIEAGPRLTMSRRSLLNRLAARAVAQVAFTVATARPGPLRGRASHHRSHRR